MHSSSQMRLHAFSYDPGSYCTVMGEEMLSSMVMIDQEPGLQQQLWTQNSHTPAHHPHSPSLRQPIDVRCYKPMQTFANALDGLLGQVMANCGQVVLQHGYPCFGCGYAHL